MKFHTLQTRQQRKVQVMQDFKFWGAATIGTKGQFVIPADAREQLGFDEGDKLLIMSAVGGKGIIAIKPEVLEEFMKKTTVRLQDVLKSAKEDKAE